MPPGTISEVPWEGDWPDDRICKNHERGVHIELRCKLHPGLTWSTKNLHYIGARSIFYNLHGDPKMGPECSCSINELFHEC